MLTNSWKLGLNLKHSTLQCGKTNSRSRQMGTAKKRNLFAAPSTPILLTTRDRISIGKGSLMDISTLFQVALIEFDRIVMGGDS